MPTTEYRGVTWTVDFRLQELRFVVDGQLVFLPFRDIRDGKLKQELRGLRARVSELCYMEGLDD